ncbi:MAG: oxidoreductase [Alphaproteobacteria bacterium]
MLAFICLLPAAAVAESLPQPSGKVILTVSGNIRNTNGDGVAEFDRAMLEALGMTELQTSTDWTTGRPVFEGVPANALLEAVGAGGTTARAIALNDYVVDIPLADFRDYPVVLALKVDGKYMRVRDKGPIWVVYPHEQYEELKAETFQVRWIWQLRRLEIQ